MYVYLSFMIKVKCDSTVEQIKMANVTHIVGKAERVVKDKKRL